MNSATYNLHDDRLKVWFSDRLSETEYNAAKAAGFVWWRGSKCFTCVWRPAAEDFLIARGIEIEAICEADDVAARVDRFEKYANNAEETAANAAERLETGAANTARRVRLAENVAAREFSTAAHWQRRIAGAIRHAQFKENPGAIVRRIATLEADLRRFERNGQARWAEHMGHRLEYERARLAATGDIRAQLASNEVTIEKGGALQLNRRRVCAEGWYFITRVNPSTVEVYSPHEEAWRGKFRKIPRDEITEYAAPARVESGEIQCAKPAELPASNQPRGVAKSRTGETPELFGAFFRSGGFGEDAPTYENAYLITKLNRISVEYIHPFTEKIHRGGEVVTEKKYYGGKTEIYGLRGLMSAADVKAKFPQLLDDWRTVQEIRARRDARKKEAAA